MRTDAVHAKGDASILGSACFLQNYWESLLGSQHGQKMDENGKVIKLDRWVIKLSKMGNKNRVFVLNMGSSFSCLAIFFL